MEHKQHTRPSGRPVAALIASPAIQSAGFRLDEEDPRGRVVAALPPTQRAARGQDGQRWRRLPGVQAPQPRPAERLRHDEILAPRRGRSWALSLLIVRQLCSCGVGWRFGS